MKKLCIFDFDGTLADTIESITFFVNKTLAHFSLSELDTDTIASYVGNGAKKLIERVLEHNGSNIPVDEALSVYMNYYDNDPTYLVKIFDGIYDVLNTLKENNVEAAILSNKPDTSTNMIADYFFEKGTFYKCLGKSERFKTKPDPESANYIAEGFDKENCYFIGDSDVDIITGKNANMKTIAVTWGLRKKEVLHEQNPDYIVDSPKEILSIVLHNNA